MKSHMQISSNHITFLLLLLVVSIYSCTSDGFKEGETGYRYKIVRDGEGPVFENNQYIQYCFEK